MLDLSVGNHNLYLRRRQPDSLEVQQMKTQAKEERMRKQEARHRLETEQIARSELERERNRLQQEVQHLREQVQMTQEALVSFFYLVEIILVLVREISS